MRDTHSEQVERWANFVRTNPNWRIIHNEFIDAIFDNHEKFIQKLLKTDKGKEKIITLLWNQEYKRL